MRSQLSLPVSAKAKGLLHLADAVLVELVADIGDRDRKRLANRGEADVLIAAERALRDLRQASAVYENLAPDDQAEARKELVIELINRPALAPSLLDSITHQSAAADDDHRLPPAA
jgi:hypothetical protein